MTIRSRDRQRAEQHRRSQARLVTAKRSTTKYTQTTATPEQLAFRDLCEAGVPADVARIAAYSKDK